MIEQLKKIWDWWTANDDWHVRDAERLIMEDHHKEKYRKEAEATYLKNYLGTTRQFSAKGHVVGADLEISRNINAIPGKMDSVREIRKEADRYVVCLLSYLGFDEVIKEYEKIKKDFPFREEIVDEPKIIIP